MTKPGRPSWSTSPGATQTDPNLYHYLDVQFAGGDTRKIRVDRKLWNLLSAGDEIVKTPGQDPIRK